MAMNIKHDDTVVVTTGKDKGKKGKVLVALPKEDRVVVQGVNVVTRHKKPKNQQDAGGLIHQEAPVHVSNVMLVCPECGKPSRVGKKELENGKHVRVCKKCGATIEK